MACQVNTVHTVHTVNTAHTAHTVNIVHTVNTVHTRASLSSVFTSQTSSWREKDLPEQSCRCHFPDRHGRQTAITVVCYRIEYVVGGAACITVTHCIFIRRLSLIT